jgi:hypothetical protein
MPKAVVEIGSSKQQMDSRRIMAIVSGQEPNSVCERVPRHEQCEQLDVKTELSRDRKLAHASCALLPFRL